MTNRQWISTCRPQGRIDDGVLTRANPRNPNPARARRWCNTFTCRWTPPTGSGMSAWNEYMPPVKLGEVMRGSTIGRVLRCTPAFAEGDLVYGFGGYQDCSIARPDTASKLTPVPGAPLVQFMDCWHRRDGVLHALDIGKPQVGELVVVGAAGAVGRWPHRSPRSTAPA
jgi:NADPH-dependent curcumin reductase CurA